MEEIWKDIEGFEGLYQVSNLGNVKRLTVTVPHKRYGSLTTQEHYMSKTHDQRGYLKVMITKNNRSICRRIHVLVWDAFGHSSRNGRIVQVDHKDNNKENNNIDNLQLLNTRDNCIKRELAKSPNKITGVYFHKKRCKWIAGIRIGKRQVWSKGFDTKEEAILAYENLKKKVVSEASF